MGLLKKEKAQVPDNENSDNEQLPTVAKLYPRCHLVAALFGFYVEGTQDVYSSKLLRFWAYFLIHAALLNLAIRITGTIHFFIFGPKLPFIALLGLFRSCSVMIAGIVKMYLMSYSRRFASVLNPWADSEFLLLGKHDRKNRQETLDKMIWSYARPQILSFVLVIILTVTYGMSYVISPQAKGSHMVYIPHNPASPYHWVHIILLNCISLIIFTTNMLNVFIIINFCMVSTQLQYLKEKLADIFGTIEVDENGKVQCEGSTILSDDLKDVVSPLDYDDAVSRVRSELRRWVHVHKKTLIWAKDLNDVYYPFNTLMFCHMALYAITFVYTLPYYVRNQMYFDIMMNVSYACNLYILGFGVVRIVDSIYENSADLAGEGYDKGWYSIPRKLQKAFQIILIYSMSRPIRLKFLYKFDVNTSNFKAILGMAYKGLSLLWQMEV